jgi:hypothetical protein
MTYNPHDTLSDALDALDTGQDLDHYRHIIRGLNDFVPGCTCTSVKVEDPSDQIGYHWETDQTGCELHDPDLWEGAGDEPDQNDDFPMYLEYDGLWGASDFASDQAAAEQDRFESEGW